MQVNPSLRASGTPQPPKQTQTGSEPFGKALLDTAPRFSLGVADAFVAGYAHSAPGLSLGLGVIKAVGGFFEAAGNNTEFLGKNNTQKGLGDFLSGIGLIAASMGAGIPGVALTVGGDAVAAFGRLRESY